MIKLIAFIKVILLKKIPAVVVLIFSAMVVLFMSYYPKVNSPQAIPMVQNTQVPICDENLRMTRINDYDLTRPLLFVDVPNESSELGGVKSEIESEIKKEKDAGNLTSAAVVLRKNGGKWISINNDETYGPGSLIKVPLMITYLKLAEKNPAWLTKEIMYAQKKNVPAQTFNSNQIISGRKYTVKELLRYMIVYSDNNATLLLNENVDVGALEKLFTDVGLPKPDVHDKNYGMTASEYTRFFRILYNSSYLSPDDSEFGLNLLTETSFNEGITQPIPKTIKVAHKFGETGDKVIHQLHEAAIVYNGNDTYLLTVMTKGEKVDALPKVISNISQIVFKNSQQQNN